MEGVQRLMSENKACSELLVLPDRSYPSLVAARCE